MSEVTPLMLEEIHDALGRDLDRLSIDERQAAILRAWAAGEAARPGPNPLARALGVVDRALFEGPCYCDETRHDICHLHRCLEELGDALAEETKRESGVAP